MILRHGRWLLFFAGCLAVSLVARLPADAWNPALERWSGDRIVLGDASGSFWQGSGLLYWKVGAEVLPLGPVAWSFAGEWADGGPRLAIGGNAPGRWRITWGAAGSTLELAGVQLPAQILLPAMAGNFLSADWRGSLAVEQAELRRPPNTPQVYGRLRMRWVDWGHPGLSPNRFGTLQVAAQAEQPGEWRFRLDSQGEGGVAVRGDGQWNAISGKRNFRGEVIIPPAERERLEPVLNGLGRYSPPQLFVAH